MAVTKVLVADDSATQRQFLNRMLVEKGCAVTLAVDGNEAVAKSKEVMPDVILMDLVMPGLNGFQATRIISRSSATKHIPIIICTIKGQETDRVWGLRQGAQDYIVKPIKPSELFAKIATLVRFPYTVPPRPTTPTATTNVELAAQNTLSVQTLKRAEQHLANHIGPISRILVQRAAERTDSLPEFYRLLASNIADQAARREFLGELTH